MLPIGQKIIMANVLARGANRQNIAAATRKVVDFKNQWNTDGKIKEFPGTSYYGGGIF